MSNPRKIGNFTDRQQKDYQAGRLACRSEASIDTCALLDEARAACWRAGWHDADYAKGNRVYRGPSSNIKKMLAPDSKAGANKSTRYTSTTQQEIAA